MSQTYLSIEKEELIHKTAELLALIFSNEFTYISNGLLNTGVSDPTFLFSIGFTYNKSFSTAYEPSLKCKVVDNALVFALYNINPDWKYSNTEAYRYFRKLVPKANKILTTLNKKLRRSEDSALEYLEILINKG